MPVPHSKRVKYLNNPLEDVTCKLQFPPVLRIDAEMPIAFQERVRREYPLLQTGSSITLPAGVPERVAQAFQHDFPGVPRRSFAFSTSDSSWTLKLAKSEMSLSCRNYDSWESFGQRLAGPLEALVQIYEPSFYTHVCARYRNVIRRHRLGLDGVPWSSLLQSWICGPLGRDELKEEVESLQARCVMRLPGTVGRIDATYGLATEGPGKQSVFLIDTHAYNQEQTGHADVSSLLDMLSRQAGSFFRWCLTDQLHRALGPLGGS